MIISDSESVLVLTKMNKMMFGLILIFFGKSSGRVGNDGWTERERHEAMTTSNIGSCGGTMPPK